MPRVVLNQRQVLIVVSDWEPYSLGISWVIVPVSVFVAPDRAVSVFHVFCFCILFVVSSFIKDVYE